MNIINTCDLHIKSWCPAIEESAEKQIFNLSKLPFAFHHIAVMPDCHMGFGMPIGGVLATKGIIIPNAVGVDIGCGMHAVKTSLKELDVETLKKIMGEIRKQIPVGFDHRKVNNRDKMPVIGGYAGNTMTEICTSEFQSACHQLGTLGGGNHFIEFQKGSDGHIWFMIHSGSRNLGKQVCDHYNKIAKQINEKYYSSVPKEFDLAFFPLDSEEGQNYYGEMQYCLEFAKANRQLMADDIKNILYDLLVSSFGILGNNPIKHFTLEEYDVHHNYVTMEHHFSANVLVHRKGATRAYKDEICLIPGSQGTKSYIAKGLGNPDSFMSCSHGAGRKMSRTKAKEQLNLEEQQTILDNQGIIHGMRTKDTLDEAPGAYKDIVEVMEQQNDLVSILVELTPLAVIKA